MKKIILFSLLSVIFLPGNDLMAQSKNEMEQEIISQLCQKWKYRKMSSGKTELPVPIRFENTWIHFHHDGSYTRNSKGEESKGYWELDRLTLTLHTADKKETEKHRLVSVTGTELILRSNISGIQMNMTLERVE